MHAYTQRDSHTHIYVFAYLEKFNLEELGIFFSLSVFCFEFFCYHWLNKQVLLPNDLRAFFDQLLSTFGIFPSLAWYEHSNEAFLTFVFPS